MQHICMLTSQSAGAHLLCNGQMLYGAGLLLLNQQVSDTQASPSSMTYIIMMHVQACGCRSIEQILGNPGLQGLSERMIAQQSTISPFVYASHWTVSYSNIHHHPCPVTQAQELAMEARSDDAS